MKALALVALVLLVAPLLSQTAKVEELNPDEANQAKALYAEQKDVEKRIEDFRKSIAKKYTMEEKYATEPYCINNSSTGLLRQDLCSSTRKTKTKYLDTKEGWESGFQFSEDYRFIVPAHSPNTITYNCSGYVPGGSYVVGDGGWVYPPTGTIYSGK